MRIAVVVSIVLAAAAGPADRFGRSPAGPVQLLAAAEARYGRTIVQPPPAPPAMVDSPTVKVLTGLTVQEFEADRKSVV